jgi:hypothetical protein
MWSDAQNSAHEYHHVIERVVPVHGLPHSGMANVEYAAAASAITLKRINIVQR